MMDRERILTVLNDLAMVIGGEINLQPLLMKTLQRLLFHTSFPCGMVFLDTPEASGSEMIDARLALSIGDFDLARYNGKTITVPAPLLAGPAVLAENRALFNRLPCRRDYYTAYLRLPIAARGFIILLSPKMPETDLPFTQIFQPVLSNLAKAVLLCRNNEAYMQRIIDERQAAEAALQDLSYRNSLILASLEEGICGLDQNGITTSVNPAAARMLGFQPEELVGRPLHEIIHYDQRANRVICSERCPLMHAIRDGVLCRIAEDAFYTKNGETFPVEYTSSPLCENDRIIGVVLIFQDITERKKREQDIRQLASIVESSDDAIIGKTLDGEILSWNAGAEALYGYSAEEMRGRSIAALIPSEYRDDASRILDEIRIGRHVHHYETRRMRKDGRTIPVSLTVSPVKDIRGTIIGASAIARDITQRIEAEREIRTLNEELEQRVIQRTADLNQTTEELKRANARLSELDRLKSMFIASMSHELRTPLNSVIGFSSILLNEWLGPMTDEQKENLATILRSGKHLLNLINDVIDVSKIESGKIMYSVEEFDLVDLLAEGLDLVRKDAEEKGLSLSLDAGHYPLRTDRRRLLQCVINLLSNAVKFTEQGGITVQAHLAAPNGSGRTTMQITVADTGIGIKEEDMPKLFQPFVRLVSPIQATRPGTGLGLYLTRKLMKDVLQGEIVCESVFGAGSRFIVHVPTELT